MRVLVPLALATSAVVALNLRGQDAPVESSNQEVAPMHSRDDLRILWFKSKGASSSQQSAKPKRQRGLNEIEYRERGGELGASTGAVARVLAGGFEGSFAGPAGSVGGIAAGGLFAGKVGGKRLWRSNGGYYGRRNSKVQALIRQYEAKGNAVKRPAARPGFA
ncbi:unnamed protein product [Aphanomyces euteiches]